MTAYKSNINQFNSSEIANEIKFGKGYVVLENILEHHVIADIINIIKTDHFLVNHNNVGVVRAGQTNFHSHTLCASKNCYNLITDQKTRSFCLDFFDGPFKLSNQRIYETHTKAHMPWHTDNNIQSGSTFNGKHNLPGILFLFYLTDVSKINSFQLIPGSQNWSANHNERFFSDTYINENFKEQIVSVKAPKGTLILCNTHLIHRAEPFNSKNFRRFTFLFQVDAISEAHTGHGEKLLIDPAFVNDTDPDILQYLGFGLESNSPSFPQTSVASMAPSDLWKLQMNIFPRLIKSVIMSVIKAFLPRSLHVWLQNFKASRFFK